MYTIFHTAGSPVMTVTFTANEPDPLTDVILDIDFLLHPAWPAVGQLVLRPETPGNSFRSLTVELPADLEISYRYLRRSTEDPGGTNPIRHHCTRDEQSLNALRTLCAGAKPDPEVSEQISNAFGSGVTASVLVGPLAACGHDVWGHKQRPTARIHSAALLAGYRTVHLLVSNAALPEHLVLLLDGDVWMDSLNLPTALERWNRPEVTFAVVSTPDRENLANRSFMSSELLQHVLPAVEEALGTHVKASAVTIVGHSYSGLAAAGIACDHPDRIANAIIGSGSFWYRDSHDARDDPEPGDLTRELTCASGRRLEGSRFMMHVGREEGQMITQSTMFAEAATRLRARADITVYPGGHDYAWYRHALFTALDELLDTP